MPYNSDEMEAINAEVNSCLDGFTSDCVVSYKDVVEAVNCLKFGKNDGYTGLSTNHVKYGPDELFVLGTCESFFLRSNRISNRIGRIYHASRNTV